MLNKFLKSTSIGKTKHKMIEFYVIIDENGVANDKPVTVLASKNSTLRSLRRQITQIKNKEKNFMWFINDKFWKDEDNLITALGVSDLDSKVGNEIHLIEISDNDDDKNNVSDDPGYLELATPENVDEPSICQICHAEYPKSELTFLKFCKHQLCKRCAKESLLNLKKNFKCPIENCSQILCDHEIQEALSENEYKKFETLILCETEENKAFINPKVGWVCESCTFINSPFIEFCDVCSSNRPDMYQIPSYWKPNTAEQKIMKQNEDLKKREKELENIQIEKENKEKLEYLEKLKQLCKESVTMTSETTECPICLCEYDAGEAIVLHSCLHTICKDCIRNYLINIENAQVKCPTENCIGLVEDQEIHALLTEVEYAKYQELNLRMAEAKEKFAFHCKEVNCIAWIAFDGIVRTFKCPRCSKENCIPCQAIHEGQTCVQYNQNRHNDHKASNADELFIQKMIQSGEAMKCPGCGILVQKNRGCDGVTCKSCGIMMCWATKGPRWGPKGKGDTSGGCGCKFFFGRRCHPSCRYCH